jgi:ABC-2 type transport system permease protein
MWRPGLIAKREYIRHVRRKSFIGALFMPLIMLMIIAIIIFVTYTSIEASNRGTIGYIDPSNALHDATSPPNTPYPVVAYANEETANAALTNKTLIAYFKLAPDFAKSSRAELIFLEKAPDRNAIRAFEQFAKSTLLRNLPPEIQTREKNGITLILETPDKTRSFGGINLINWLLPIGVGVLFIIALFSGAQYLVQAVLEEKENRTMEVMVTSVTPLQMLTGKLIGLAAVGLTQIGAWLMGILMVLAALQQFVPQLQNARIEPRFIVIALLLFVLQYLLFGALMIGLGSAVANAKDGQQLATPFVLLSLVPEFMIPLIFLNPNGVISVGLSVMPITSSLALLLRYAVTDVPLWQIAMALVLQSLAVIAALWLSARIFRLGMLRYGQRVGLTEIWQTLQSK